MSVLTRSLFEDLLKEVSPGYYIKPLHGDPLPSQIKIDVKENANEFIVHADIPGAGKDNIHIDIEGNLITIRAQLNQLDSENKDERTIRTERYYGEISRSFQLAAEIDQQSSKAKYENGVLILNLVKKTKTGGKRLTIE